LGGSSEIYLEEIDELIDLAMSNEGDRVFWSLSRHSCFAPSLASRLGHSVSVTARRK
jgi:hypothetical protein